jgi:hypothetical protein
MKGMIEEAAVTEEEVAVTDAAAEVEVTEEVVETDAAAEVEVTEEVVEVEDVNKYIRLLNYQIELDVTA